MTSVPLVSVIIPCYNYGHYLSEALNCISEQTFSDWECIIVNDGSNDRTEEVALDFSGRDPRFRYFRQPNSGHSAARNHGLREARGEYVQFLDADDKLSPQKLALHTGFLQSRADADLVYGDVIYFDDHGPMKEQEVTPIFKKPRISGKNKLLLDNLMDDNFFTPGCTLFRKTIFEKIGGLKASYGFEDWEFWYRAALMGFSFHYDARPGTELLVRNHEMQTTRKYKEMMLSKPAVRREIISVMERWDKEKKLNLPDVQVRSLVRKQKHLLGLDEAFYHLRYGSLLTGFKHLLLHSVPSGEPYRALYETYHLLRARQKSA